MLEPDVHIMLDITPDSVIEWLLNPVREKTSPLSLMISRFKKIAAPLNIVLIGGHRPEENPLGNFAALNGVSLFRTYATEPIKRAMNASTSRRAKRLVLVDARNTFVDTDIIEKLVEFHDKQKSSYSYTENLPEWLRAEIFDGPALIDAFMMAEKDDSLDMRPGTYMLKEKNTFKSSGFRPNVGRKWKNGPYSLTDQQAAALVFSAIRSTADPSAISINDFRA